MLAGPSPPYSQTQYNENGSYVPLMENSQYQGASQQQHSQSGGPPFSGGLGGRREARRERRQRGGLIAGVIRALRE